MKLAFLSPFTSNEFIKYFPDIKNYNIPPGMGGSAVFELVHGLIEKGIDLHLITQDSEAENIFEFHNKNVHYYIIPRRKRGSLRDIYKQERNYIKKLLIRINPDIVHANWTYEYALAALDFNVNKTLVTAHDIPLKVLRYSSFHYLILFFISYYVYYKSKALVFVSNSVKKYAEPFLDKNKIIEIIPNIVDLRDLDLSKVTVSTLPEKYFVSIALWNKLKNLKYSLNAFKLFVKDNPGYYYVLIGPGMDNNSEVSKYISEYKIDNIILLGKLSRLETLKILSRSIALIHPSFTEACPMVVGEAMKLGVPVIIGKNSDGAEEIINFGEYGYLIDLNNVNILVDILNLFKNNQNNVSYIERAKKYVEYNFNKDKIVSSYIRLYNRIKNESY